MAVLAANLCHQMDLNFSAQGDGDPNMPVEITGLDLHCKENSSQHRTNRFALTSCGEDSHLVVRRGQVFRASFVFNRRVNWATDQIVLVFCGQGSSEFPIAIPAGQVTNVEQVQLQPNGWSIALVFNEGCILTLAILPSPDAPVGLYKMRFEVTNSATNSKRGSNMQDSIYLLFNPWHPDDTVFMEDENLRTEYVLNEYGKVYQGTYDEPIGKAWFFGQFDTIVLPTISYLIELGKVTSDELRCPVAMARRISALVDQTDDAGILRGRWDNDYADGVSPIMWSSSTSILEMYMRRGGAPVSYGQCWVYAALVTTLCRALGMPCRPVTNFESAHDTDGNMCVDCYADENGISLNEINKDSSWNFHLWNEAWMKRPDLGTAEFDGWQAFDGTPQEKSNGQYQMGPCPVRAVQMGRIEVKYDTKFVFSETNALFYDWVRDRSEPTGWKVVQTNRQAGVLILTKKPGVLAASRSIDDAENITLSYRCLSAAEQLSQKKQADSMHSSSEDVQYDLIKVTHVRAGENMQIQLLLKNKSLMPRTVRPTISVFSLEYTGAISQCVKRVKLNEVQVPSQADVPCSISVSLEEYQDKITAFGLLKVMAGAKVLETEKTWAGQFTTKLEMPKLDIVAQRNRTTTSEIIYSVSFINPLTIPLSHCELNVNIPGIATHETIRNLSCVPGQGRFAWQGKAISERIDEKTFIVTFNSDRLAGLEGTFTAVI
ncbi:hemocyte protein-glutamine gamma-glutamyltransferase-like [Tropilaelaps mercedesae]|uniref:Hemocyte protein-glutamine gamma-glutamyltransferase-like n=1 Tax=Tropilaelaps mercedesae TaxID=418985 RepID=A0A1V9XVP2_9ACAR|nr:hemocyte protein-glutamine gamma-glutamyltransferase-like [Tropilaelaps mercedesae]